MVVDDTSTETSEPEVESKRGRDGLVMKSNEERLFRNSTACSTAGVVLPDTDRPRAVDHVSRRANAGTDSAPTAGVRWPEPELRPRARLSARWVVEEIDGRLHCLWIAERIADEGLAWPFAADWPIAPPVAPTQGDMRPLPRPRRRTHRARSRLAVIPALATAAVRRRRM
jgi:hypothetical protein